MSGFKLVMFTAAVTLYAVGALAVAVGFGVPAFGAWRCIRRRKRTQRVADEWAAWKVNPYEVPTSLYMEDERLASYAMQQGFEDMGIGPKDVQPSNLVVKAVEAWAELYGFPAYTVDAVRDDAWRRTVYTLQISGGMFDGGRATEWLTDRDVVGAVSVEREYERLADLLVAGAVATGGAR